jgi:hypothetical protein
MPVPSLPKFGVKVTLQLYGGELPPRVHDEELNEPVPEELKLTVPVGVTAVPGLPSATVAVHVLGLFTGSEDGEQERIRVVIRGVTPTGRVP